MFLPRVFSEIIETYRNVNDVSKIEEKLQITEIIEKYWNVNTEMKLTAESL